MGRQYKKGIKEKEMMENCNCEGCNNKRAKGKKLCHRHHMQRYKALFPEKYRENYKKQNEKRKILIQTFKNQQND
jgi:hypothetical protein